MDQAKLKDLKERSKQGSLGALIELVEYMRDESQDNYNRTKGDFRYHQSRLHALNEIVDLLPDVSK